jgi:hypothetical protein
MSSIEKNIKGGTPRPYPLPNSPPPVRSTDGVGKSDRPIGSSQPPDVSKIPLWH